jgi:SAM-dependent methyltransferase
MLLIDTIATSTPHGNEPVSDWVQRYAQLVRKQGSVLDVACGAGRHAKFFAAMGMKVTGVDKNAAALAELTQHGIETLWADIENGLWPFEGRSFDMVIVTNYLWRPLLPHIAACVSERGVIIYETFAQGNERYGKPSNPDYLLAADELMQHFGPKQGFEVIAYEDITLEKPKPARVQRIAAVKQPAAQ